LPATSKTIRSCRAASDWIPCGRCSKFTGQILPETKRVDYRIDIKRVINRRLVLGVADGEVRADGELIYQATDLQVGLFENPKSL